ncbi:DUF4539 and/or tRNA anti-codon domain containing protein [Asbolus verrucosus]|uniref:DUF4539 and/or tRNA anti-codon domain containing protein n=1 Tax=Asbolus verrucosus TaxID=1661398 RepID=A0A482W6W3_ASBVE|nr:DUF4539 and/or tRNA anti-codon domain containing protein [Asbolus verrucosus]
MFENNADFDFDDDLSLNAASVKRPGDSAPDEVVKKPKINLPKNVVKRKFPGPAGILPENFSLTVSKSDSKNSNDEMPCSQMSLTVFQNGPWFEMSRDYDKLLEKFNIKWIKTSAGLNKLRNQKAPFLGAIIQNIECLDGKNPIVNVILKDTTGEIQGTIIHNLYEEYSSSLQVGSVIVLKHFGVLTTHNNHYLTITLKNLVTIYTKSKDGDEESEVRVIKVQQIGDVDCDAVPKEKPQKKTTGNIFEDDLALPDNFDDYFLEDKQRKFNFKKKIVISSSQVSVSTSEEDSEIWQNALEGVDADSFFEDF